MSHYALPLCQELPGLEEMPERLPVTPSIVQGMQVPKLCLRLSLPVLGRSECCFWSPLEISAWILPLTSEDAGLYQRWGCWWSKECPLSRRLVLTQGACGFGNGLTSCLGAGLRCTKPRYFCACGERGDLWLVQAAQQHEEQDDPKMSRPWSTALCLAQAIYLL